jgi:hypothetical protein
MSKFDELAGDLFDKQAYLVALRCANTSTDREQRRKDFIEIERAAVAVVRAENALREAPHDD